MQIKFLNAKNFKTFSLVAAIVLIVFQLVKSVSSVVTQIGVAALNLQYIEWSGARVIPGICQNIVGILVAIIALAGAAALAFAVIAKKKNKIAVLGATAFAAAEIISLLSVVVFGLIGVFMGGKIILGLISWLISVVAQLIFALAYVMFLAIISKGIAPESKVSALLDKVPEKFRSYLLYLPGALLIVGGVVSVVVALFAVISMISGSAASAAGGIVGSIFTIVLYAIKGVVLAIIGAWANDAVAEEVAEEAPVVEEAPAEETPAE